MRTRITLNELQGSLSYYFAMYAEYDDGHEVYVYGDSEDDCMCEIAQLVNQHGDCTYYTCINNEDRVDGVWVGRDNFIYEQEKLIMGSFSWLRADVTTERANLTGGDSYKILIPKEFGGGYIKDTYFDYGYVFYDSDNPADLYGILAYWNKCEGMIYDGDEYPSTMRDILERGHTCNDTNRGKGVAIGCYDWNIAKLKYPLKLVSVSYKGTYEECPFRSYGDPYQGFFKTYWRAFKKCIRWESDDPDVNYWKIVAYDEKDRMIEEYEKRRQEARWARKMKMFIQINAS